MKRLLILITGLLFTSAMVYAGNGDLIVNGNVGIGTTNPGAWSLRVGNSQSTGQIYTQYSNSIIGAGAYNGGSFAIRNVLPSEDFAVDIYDRVGANGWVNRFFISNQGAVGIGTTNPAYTLDVAGTIRGSNVSPSDIRFKKDIQPVDTPLNKLLSLNGVSYQWKTDEYKDKGFPEGRHYGVIAQEIEKVLPEVVNTAPDGTKSVAYTEIIPVLIEAVKEQQKAMDEQKKEIDELKTLVKQLTGE